MKLEREGGCSTVLPIKPGVSVYHVVLAGRVQRYSPIYYPDSHANSALATRRFPAWLPLPRMLVRLRYTLFSSSFFLYPCFLLVDRNCVYVCTCMYARLPVPLYTEMRLIIPANPTILRRAHPTWQGFQMTLHPRYEALYDPF